MPSILPSQSSAPARARRASWQRGLFTSVLSSKFCPFGPTGGPPKGKRLVAVSLHLHLRATAESEIRDEHAWLAAFMSEAWDNHPDEYAAGIADSIEKVFKAVNDLYAAADALDADVDKP